MKRKWPWLVAGIVILSLLAVAFFTLLLPYMQARSTAAPTGILTVRQQSDDSLTVSWEAVPGADFYCVEILEPITDPEQEPVVLFRDWIYGGTAYKLPGLDPDQRLTLRITPGKDFAIYGETYQRYSETWLEVTTTFDAPTLSDLQHTVDANLDVLNAAFTMKKGDCCVVSRQNSDGSLTELYRVTDGKVQITFGEGKDVAAPQWNQKETFVFSVERQLTGMIYYGKEAGRITMVGEDLLDRELNLQTEDLGNNLYRLTWEETKGEYFEVQMRRDETQEWTTVKVVNRDQERVFETPQLEPFQHYEYRVAALGGQTMKDSQFAAISEPITMDTDAAALYCTIWPVKDLQGYADPGKTQEVTKVETGKAYCVLAEEQGMFQVLTPEGQVYIDSDYCMINLPEYLGELCAYKITNSYNSKYLVHEYEMPRISGTVVKGYEDIKLADGSYLVPLLYPTAQLLRRAALTARDHGYRLKIYDAYRPNVATVRLYDRMEGMIDDPIPDKTYTGKKVQLEEVEDPALLTYRFVMTNNEWPLNNFLAKGTSKHNLGIAVDLTLESLDDGTEVKMQTSMHDLSWYSCRKRNNDSARILSQIMTSVGFSPLSSEWWHFNDLETRDRLDLSAVKNGFNCECWMADACGWRYRAKDGTYYTDCTKTIDGTEYTFDDNGYIQGTP